MVVRIQPVQSKKAQAAVLQRIRRKRSLIAVLVLCVVIGSLDRITGDASLPVSSQMISVYNTETKQLMQLDLEVYITGVIAAEMPASFALDALKAQAVAARTFAINRIQHPNAKVAALHPDAQITTSPDTCQAWIDDATQKERWGRNYEQWHNKIVQAVAETSGEVLLYDGVLIEPVYHASCGGGFTEAAEHVWGTAKPYLVSVVCNHPADQHSGEVTMVSVQELLNKLHLDNSAAAVMSGNTAYMQVTERTAANRVKTVQIGDVAIRGGELRNALGLKSTWVEWELLGDTIVFTTNGYGHGAGMCQHGADYYAEQGCNYKQILQHYYPGTALGSA